LDSELTGARERKSDPKLLAQLELAEDKIRSAGLVDSIGFSLMDNAHKELQIPDIVEAGIAFTKALNEVNELRVDAGERKYSVTWALSDWVYSCKKTTKAENRILFSQEINRFINEKSGSSGGKGNQPLGKGALNEWKLHVSKYLLNWIGNEKLGADPDVLFNLVKRKINSGVNESGVDKGKAWSMGYRHKCGSKISQFGRWLTRNRKLGINPFENLPIEFPKEEKGLVEGFETAQVTKLFKAAAEINNGDMIPYFALLFYSTCRPEDIADPKVKEERLQWKNFKGWAYEDEGTGGYEFWVKKWEEIGGQTLRRSKTKDRIALLLPTGADWIRWYYGKLPTEGQVYWSRRIRKKILEKAGIKKWIQDGARHTLLSHARHYKNYASTQEDWARRAGHDTETFRGYYSAPVTQVDCKTFFEKIKPSKKKGPQG
jgi:hypothetical protein